jgi:hypothetical protein
MASTVSLVSTVERDWSARLALEVAILRNREQPHNEELQLTKGSAWAAFAAELRCSADISGLVTTWLAPVRREPDDRDRLSARWEWS